MASNISQGSSPNSFAVQIPNEHGGTTTIEIPASSIAQAVTQQIKQQQQQQLQQQQLKQRAEPGEPKSAADNQGVSQK